jgi:phosphopantetheinyl transferase
MLKRGLLDLSLLGAQDFIAAFATEDDRYYAARYQRAARRDQSVAGRALLRALVNEALDVDHRSVVISRTASGRPRIEAHPQLPRCLDISIAHSGHVVVAAVTDLGAIGIDVEDGRAERAFDDIATKIFGYSEQDAVRRDGKPAFYRIWALREAFAKATDLGFAGVLSTTDRFAGAADRFVLDTEQRRWVFQFDRYRDVYAVALALGVMPEMASTDVNAALPQDLATFPRRKNGASVRATSL